MSMMDEDESWGIKVTPVPHHWESRNHTPQKPVQMWSHTWLEATQAWTIEGPAGKAAVGDGCILQDTVDDRRWGPCHQMHWRGRRKSMQNVSDMEDFSPVLRSLARWKPTMTLLEKLQRAVQEWRHTRNFDRMIYYEMKAKIKEFESEEERQIQMLEERNGSQLHQQLLQSLICSVHTKKTGTKTQFPKQRQHRHQRTLKMKAPKKISPEAMKEYTDIMNGLVRLLHSASEGADGKWEEEEHENHQEEKGIYADLDLLSYIDQLCAEEDFVTKLIKKRLLVFKDGEGMEAPTSYDIPIWDSVPSMSKKSPSVESTGDHGLPLRKKNCTDAIHWDCRADKSLALPKDLAVSPRHLEPPESSPKKSLLIVPLV